MDWTAIGTGIAVIAFTYTMLRNFKIDIDKRFDALFLELKEIRKDIGRIEVQVGKLETRVEERTLRVHYPETGTQA